MFIAFFIMQTQHYAAHDYEEEDGKNKDCPGRSGVGIFHCPGRGGVSEVGIFRGIREKGSMRR